MHRISNILITGVSERESKKEELIQESKGILKIVHKLLKKHTTRSDTKNQESRLGFSIPTQETRKQ